MYTSLSDGTYNISFTDGSELVCSLANYSVFTDLLRQSTTLQSDIHQKEQKKTLIDIITDPDILLLREKEKMLLTAQSRWMTHLEHTLQLLSDIDIVHTSVIFRKSMEYFFQGNLFEAILSLDDPQIEEEGKKDEQSRTLTFWYYRYKAYLHLLLDEKKKAAIYFEKIIYLSPNAMTYQWYGDLLAMYHEREKALQVYEQGLSTCLLPIDMATISGKIGSIYHDIHKHREAIFHASQSIQYYQQAAQETGSSITSSLATSVYLLASCYEEQKQFPQAISQYQRVLTLYQMITPQTEQVQQHICKVHLHMSMVQYQLSYIEASQTSLLQAFESLKHVPSGKEKTTIERDIRKQLISLLHFQKKENEYAQQLENELSIVSNLARLDPHDHILDMISVLSDLEKIYLIQKRKKDHEIVKVYGKRLTDFYTTHIAHVQKFSFTAWLREVLRRFSFLPNLHIYT